MQTIKIITKSKSSSIRISERTKKMLEALSVGKETHEQIILRLIGLVDKISSEDGTMITEKKNILGIKYSRRNEKIVIETRKNKYSIVFTYNDLTPFMKFRILQLKDSNIERKATKWEVDLNLVNIATNNGKWIDPKKSKIDKREMLLVYLVILLKILDNFFDIYGHEIYDESDYLNMDNWRKLYHRNNLSMESFYDDVEKKFAEVKI